MSNGEESAHFTLVTAAHHFLLDLLPIRRILSVESLDRFLETVSTSSVPTTDREAVLVQLLAALDPHAEGRLPTLVDRYFQLKGPVPEMVERFRRCVHELLIYRGIGNPDVQRAIEIIHESSDSCDLRQAEVAETLGMTATGLCNAFKTHTGMTFKEYVRDLRLNRAAVLLSRTSLSVKEVWVSVGYSDASNFSRDFKERFHLTPGQFRSSSFSPVGSAAAAVACRTVSSLKSIGPSLDVLIVDDDLGTRETLRTFLRCHGHVVSIAASSEEGLQCMAQGTFKAVVLDFHLNGMNGLEILRQIRARVRLPRPAIVFYTADCYLDRFHEEIRELRAVLLSKLCNLADVERTLRSMAGWSEKTLASGHL